MNLLKPRGDQLCDKGWRCNDPGIASAYFTQEDLTKYTFVIPDFVESVVNDELNLIEQHSGFSSSPILIYQEDYSQYVPRGHYTRSEKLKNYFKAFMWYGRITMLLKGGDGGLISAYDTMIQTMQACLITLKFIESQELMAKWDRIYNVTAFYVGLSDDLGPYEYMEAMNFVFEGGFNLNDLTEQNIGEIKARLAEYRSKDKWWNRKLCNKSTIYSRASR